MTAKTQDWKGTHQAKRATEGHTLQACVRLIMMIFLTEVSSFSSLLSFCPLHLFMICSTFTVLIWQWQKQFGQCDQLHSSLSFYLLISSCLVCVVLKGDVSFGFHAFLETDILNPQSVVTTDPLTWVSYRYISYLVWRLLLKIEPRFVDFPSTCCATIQVLHVSGEWYFGNIDGDNRSTQGLGCSQRSLEGERWLTPFQ